jgi:phospholipid N-methyltransferase
MTEGARFLRAFLRDPIKTGAIAPSSRRLADRMIDGLGLREADTVVELGPGTGAFTRVILEHIGAHTLFLVLELNPHFAAQLRDTLPSRVRVVNDSGEHLAKHLAAHGRGSADCIISGIPWAGFNDALQVRLMDAVVAALRSGGRFATFAYLHAARFPGGRRLRRLLAARFSRVERTSVVWRNLPPAFVYRCEK